MEIAPDFFDYFEAAATILDNDKWVLCCISVFEVLIQSSTTFNLSSHMLLAWIHNRSIMAVSSWNDNGQKQFVQDPCKFILNF